MSLKHLVLIFAICCQHLISAQSETLLLYEQLNSCYQGRSVDLKCAENLYTQLELSSKKEYGEGTSEHLRYLESLTTITIDLEKWDKSQKLLQDVLKFHRQTTGLLSEGYDKQLSFYITRYYEAGQLTIAEKLALNYDVEKKQAKNNFKQLELEPLLYAYQWLLYDSDTTIDDILNFLIEIEKKALVEWGNKDERYISNLTFLLGKLIEENKREIAKPYAMKLAIAYKDMPETNESILPYYLESIASNFSTSKDKEFIAKIKGLAEKSVEEIQQEYIVNNQVDISEEFSKAKTGDSNAIAYLKSEEGQEKMAMSMAQLYSTEQFKELVFQGIFILELFSSEKDVAFEFLLQCSNMVQMGARLTGLMADAEQSLNQFYDKRLNQKLNSFEDDRDELNFLKDIMTNKGATADIIQSRKTNIVLAQLENIGSDSRRVKERIEKLEDLSEFAMDNYDRESASAYQKEIILLYNKYYDKYKEEFFGSFLDYIMYFQNSSKKNIDNSCEMFFSHEKDFIQLLKNDELDHLDMDDQAGQFETSMTLSRIYNSCGKGDRISAMLEEIGIKGSTLSMIDQMQSSQSIAKESTAAVNKFKYGKLPNALDKLTTVSFNSSDYQKAKEYLGEIINAINPQVFYEVKEQYQLTLLNKMQQTAEANLSFIDKFVQKDPSLAQSAMNQSIRIKETALLQKSLLKELVQESKKPRLKAKYNTLMELKKIINSILVLEKEALKDQTEALFIAQKEKGRLEVEIYTLISKDKLSTKYETWQSVQKELKEDEVLVDIVRFIKRSNSAWTQEVQYAAIILHKNSKQPQYVHLDNSKEFESSLFQKYQSSRTAFELEDDSIFNGYWSQVHKHVQSFNTVYLSNEGIYHLLNVNTFFLPDQSNKQVLDAYQIKLINSPATLSKNNIAKSDKPAILFGNPDFQSKEVLDAKNEYISDGASLSSKNYLFYTNWETLDDTENEILRIKEILNSNKIPTEEFLAKNASEENLRKINRPRILHLATHAYFSKIDWAAIPGMNSSVSFDKSEYPSYGNYILNRPSNTGKDFFSDQDSIFDIDGLQEFMDTMILDMRWMFPSMNSGLIFAGVNNSDRRIKNSTNDGVFQSSEISLLDLEGTELVVLSACETGTGSLTTVNGIEGVKKSFEVAGAQNIISSLWMVKDEVAEKFMTNFYKLWLNEKMSIADAFRATQLMIRDEYERPFYWGAFVLSQMVNNNE